MYKPPWAPAKPMEDTMTIDVKVEVAGEDYGIYIQEFTPSDEPGVICTLLPCPSPSPTPAERR